MYLKDQSFSIILLSTAIALIGLLFIPYISLNLNPDYQYPSLTISTSHSNASPEEVERQITRPIESILATLPGITKMYSRSFQGSSVITLTMEKRVDMEMFKFQVLTLLRQIHQNLPEQAGLPVMTANKPGEEKYLNQILIYSVYAPISREAIYDYAVNVLSPQLAGIDGLYKIDVTGGTRKEYIIEYNDDLIKSHSLNIEILSSQIKKGLQSLQIGEIIEAGAQIRVSIQPSEIAELTKLPITIGSRVFPASTFITSYEAEEKPTSLFRINSKNNIRISFIPEAQVNQLNLGAKIKEDISKVILPPNFEILKEYDNTEFIQTELDKIKERTLYSIAILLAFVFLAYRNWKHIFIVVAGLLITVGTSFILFYLLEVQLNLYSLAAITISFGIVIDNLIVMIHHYGHYRNLSILPAIISSTMTTLASLVVFWFLPEEWRWNLTDFGRVLLINLIVSIWVAYLFTPALMIQLKYPFISEPSNAVNKNSLVGNLYKRWLGYAGKYRKTVFVNMVLLFGLPFFALPHRYDTWSWYNKTIGSDWYLEYARPIVSKYLGGTLRLFSDYVYTRASYRSNQETKLYANAYLPLGSTLQQTDELMGKLEAYLSQYKNEIKNYTTNILDHQNGQIQISFKDDVSFSFPYILERNLISFCIGLGEVEWGIYGVGKGYSNSSYENMTQFSAEIRGYNIEELDKIVDDFATLLEAHPRIEKVNRNVNLTWGERRNQQYFLSLDARKMSENNINLSALSGFLRRNSQLPTILAYSKDNKALRLQEDNLQIRDIWNIENSYQVANSATFSFTDFGKLDKQFTAPTLHKENQQHIRRCGWTYIGNEKYGQEYLDECIAKTEKVIPIGYSIKDVKNSFWGRKKNQQYWYMLLVPLIIFIIGSIHFESLLRGLQIVFIIPLSFIGIFITFYYFDFPFDQGGYVSFLITSGLSVNAVIFIFSSYNLLKKQYPDISSVDLYFLAFKDKIIPILLTILSTVLGMIPFLIHGENEVFWFALAVGTIGGLIFSLLVLILVLPAFIINNH